MSFLYKYSCFAFISSIMMYSVYAEYNTQCNNTSVIYNNCITFHQLNEYIKTKNKSQLQKSSHHTEIDKIKE